jgi:hypothetical protein
MTGREKIEAAFSPRGTPEFGAGVCYHGILLRDLWDEITDQPWWVKFDPDPAKASLPWIDLVRKTGEDWFVLPLGATREEQNDVVLEVSDGVVSYFNRATGERRQLRRPPVGGEQVAAESEWHPAAEGVTDVDELDDIISRVRRYCELVHEIGSP